MNTIKKEIQPIGEFEFQTNECVTTMIPLQKKGELRDGDLVGVVGVDVMEIDWLNYGLYWWQEGVAILGLLLIVRAVWKMFRGQKFKDINKGEAYCKKCGYILEGNSGDICVECGAKGVGVGGRKRRVMRGYWRRKLAIAMVVMMGVGCVGAIGWLEVKGINSYGLKGWYKKGRYISNERNWLILDQYHAYSEWVWRFYNKVFTDNQTDMCTWTRFSHQTHEKLYGIYWKKGKLKRRLIGKTSTRTDWFTSCHSSGKDEYWLNGGEIIGGMNQDAYLMRKCIVIHNKKTGEVELFECDGIDGINSDHEAYKGFWIDERYLLIESVENKRFILGEHVPVVRVLDVETGKIVYYKLAEVDMTGRSDASTRYMPFDFELVDEDGGKILVQKFGIEQFARTIGVPEILTPLNEPAEKNMPNWNWKVTKKGEEKHFLCGYKYASKEVYRPNEKKKAWDRNTQLLMSHSERGTHWIMFNKRPMSPRDYWQGKCQLMLIQMDMGKLIRKGLDPCYCMLGSVYCDEKYAGSKKFINRLQMDWELGYLWMMVRDDLNAVNRKCGRVILFDIGKVSDELEETMWLKKEEIKRKGATNSLMEGMR